MFESVVENEEKRVASTAALRVSESICGFSLLLLGYEVFTSSYQLPLITPYFNVKC